MVGYVFTLTDDEMDNLSTCGGYPYALLHKTRWVPFDFEESSIDMGIPTEPRFVVDGVVYKVHHQYMIRESDRVVRLLTLHKSKIDCEVIDLTTKTDEGTTEDATNTGE